MLFNKLFKSEEKETGRRSKRPVNSTRTQHTRKQRAKVNVSALRIGMFVVELDKPWEESKFMFQGVELKSQEDIIAVQNECNFVWVDYDDSSIPSSPPTSSMPRPGVGSNLSSSLKLEDELDTAIEMHSMASQAISTLFTEIRLGAEIDGSKVKQAVNGCVDSILRNPDASVWLTRIQAKHEPTAQHSLNVSALSIIIAKSMDLTNRELEDVGVCGMLHDVGKTSISSEVLNKAGPLNEAEMAEMRKHTHYGRDILVSTNSVMSGAADVALSHHERPDGQGYPRQLPDDSIPMFAKIVAIAEAYDTMTINQPYRAAFSPSEAIQELYAQRGKQFDEDLVIRFIDSVGIFPPGSIVEMTNKEIGIVLSNTSDKLRPRVIMILDAFAEPTAQRIIDLSKHETDRESKPYQIKTTHSDGAFGINVGDFQRAGLRMG